MVSQRILNVGKAKFGLVNVPHALFKFFAAEEYAERFVRRGELRIGTLYDFRQVETYDATRSDAGEGRFDYVHRSAFPELLTTENAPAPIRSVIEHTGMPIASHGGTLTIQATHPDCFVYCMSSSRRAGTAGYGEYGVRIDDPPGFFAELTRHVYAKRSLLKRPHGYAAPCLYGPRSLTSRVIEGFDEVPVAFIKPADKSSEQEIRAVWHPGTHPIELFITRCAKLRRFLSPL